MTVPRASLDGPYSFSIDRRRVMSASAFLQLAPYMLAPKVRLASDWAILGRPSDLVDALKQISGDHDFSP
jgi:hypothetical protein